MKNKASLRNKIYRKIHWFIFRRFNKNDRLRILYSTYRRGKKYGKPHEISSSIADLYITQIINEGAGIGHQISNYNAGLHYSQLFGLKHAYIPFKNKDWDRFLGFGQGEKTVEELKKQGYKVKRLPYFSEDEDYELIRSIIESYNGKKIILRTELDQFYQKQYETIPHLKKKFEAAEARKEDKLIYDSNETNIAIHIRRGDINIGQETGDVALTKRWLDMEYYVKVMNYITEKISYDKPLHIYIFSQDKDDYSVFEKYGKVTTCIDMSAKDSFLHMVRADILVISKSSFSYKPALLADGIRICPEGFWHDYPDNDKWIVMKV